MPKLATRFVSAMLLLLLAACCMADGGSIQLTMLPSITVADGRSTVTISAYVRRPSGQAVPDGTSVRFDTSLGTIKDDSIVQTVNGVARVILQTGNIPGTAKITASALGVGAITTTDIEFLSDRSLLASAKEYVEVVAPGYMMFSMDQRILGAAGASHGAKLRYREIEIDADDLQLNIPAYEVKAKKAHLKMGKVNQDFAELNLKLTSRSGTGTTTIEPSIPIAATAIGRIPWFDATRARFGLAEIHSSGIEPVKAVPEDPTTFKFEDLSDSTSQVAAKKAVVFPHKEIQFQRAEILVGGVKILKVPLYVLDLNRATNVITDQMFNINNSQLNINYPYYLSLRPGETSLFRITTGQQYGRTNGLDNGLSLNYELNWNRGDEFDGGLSLNSMTSRNWDLSAHQYIRFDDRTSLTGLLDVPEGQSIYGNLNFSKQFNGYGLGITSSSSHNIRGNRFDNEQVNLLFDRDPIKIGKLFRYTVGFNASANDTRTSLQQQSQSVVGVHLTTQLVPLKLDGFSQLQGYFTVAEQEGHNSVKGLAYQGSATLSRQFGRFASGIITYSYLQNGFNSGLTGHHQLSFSGGYHEGNFGSTIAATKALDLDKFSVFADLGYQLSHVWRLSYSYTLDRYIGNTFLDYTAALGYRIGYREIGLTFSGRTKRFGIQLLGAPVSP